MALYVHIDQDKFNYCFVACLLLYTKFESDVINHLFISNDVFMRRILLLITCDTSNTPKEFCDYCRVTYNNIIFRKAIIVSYFYGKVI